MKRAVVHAVGVALLATACQGAAPPPLAQSPRTGSPSAGFRVDVVRFWNTQHRVMAGHPGGVFAESSDVYDARLVPAEVAETALSAWRVTGDPKFLADARRQIDYAHSLLGQDHLLPFPLDALGDSRPHPQGVVGSLGQVRLALGFYTAYRATGDAEYLSWADASANAWRSLPRAPACVQGTCFELPAFLYEHAAGFPILSPPFVNPNQDAFSGCLLALLWADPHSVLHNQPAVLAEARSLLDAAVVLQLADGRIPLDSEPRDIVRYDSGYGMTALFLLQWANTVLHDMGYDAKLRAGAAWQNRLTAGGPRTERYPADGPLVVGPPPEPTEYFMRLAALATYGGDVPALQGGLADEFSKQEDFDTFDGGWMTPFTIFESLGLARSIYLPG